MKKNVLITRPCHDDATQYLYYFSGKLIEDIKFVDEYAVINLDGKKVNKKELEKVLTKKTPRLVVFNGHGSKKAICGHNNEVILDISNSNLLNGKIVCAFACDSLEELGDVCVTKGNAEVYIGYEGQFMIIIDPSKTATPQKDKIVCPFRKVYAELVLSLIAGLSVAESINKTKELIKSLIREYGVYGIQDVYGDAPLIRWALYWDLHFLSYIGNPNALI